MELPPERFVEPPRARRIRLHHHALLHAYRSIRWWWHAVWPDDPQGCWVYARRYRDHLSRGAYRYPGCRSLDDIRAEADMKEQLLELLVDSEPE